MCFAGILVYIGYPRATAHASSINPKLDQVSILGVWVCPAMILCAWGGFGLSRAWICCGSEQEQELPRYSMTTRAREHGVLQQGKGHWAGQSPACGNSGAEGSSFPCRARCEGWQEAAPGGPRPSGSRAVPGQGRRSRGGRGRSRSAGGSGALGRPGGAGTGRGRDPWSSDSPTRRCG